MPFLGHAQTFTTNVTINPGNLTVSGNIAGGGALITGTANSTSPGSYAAEIGDDNSATGWASLAVGQGNVASNYFSMAFGFYSTASGEASTALGWVTFAIGNYSTATGYVTSAPSQSSFALGQYDIGYGSGHASTWVLTDPVLEVGNGISGSPSDAFIVYKNGNAWVEGTISAHAAIRTAPSGDLTMGTFTAGTAP